MKLKLSALLPASLLALALLAGATGCTTASNATRNSTTLPKGAPTYALAVAVRGGVEPTPAQWNAMYARFSQALAARGLLLINDYSRAEHIINVEFLPDPINPNIGTALVSSIVPNQGVYGRTPTYSSYSSRSIDPLWAANYPYDRYGSYYNGYGGYNNGYDYSGASYSSTPPAVANPGTPAPVTPPVTTPTHPQRPTNPADCPPGTTPYQRPPNYVSDHPRHYGPRDGSATPPSRPQPSPNPYYSTSSDSGRSSYSSSSNSSSSYSSSSSSSSSYSAPSYSAPSYSPPSESSSSSSYSSGRDSSANKQPN